MGIMKQTIIAFSIILFLVVGCGKMVQMINNLEIWTIEELYIYDGMNRGDNLLKEHCLPGDSCAVSISPGTYTILAIDNEGGEYLWTGVTISDPEYNLVITPVDRA
jgi:hypothetical protein